MVTGGKSLKKSTDLLHPWFDGVKQTYFIIFFACCHLILSQVPNFNSLKVVSLTAAIMSFRTPKEFDLNFKELPLLHWATIPSTPGKPSKKPMWRGVLVAYAIVAFCYLSVSVSGFWASGDLVEYDVLVSLEKPRWLIIIANFMVFLHALGSYQVFVMPVFDLMESYLVQKLNFTPGRPLHLTARCTYVVRLEWTTLQKSLEPCDSSYRLHWNLPSILLRAIGSSDSRRGGAFTGLHLGRIALDYCVCQNLQDFFLVDETPAQAFRIPVHQDLHPDQDYYNFSPSPRDGSSELATLSTWRWRRIHWRTTSSSHEHKPSSIFQKHSPGKLPTGIAPP
ncbi:hypothetical protein RJ639_034083 [Escallonia herrerae]|uniref:Amino acid transporter transmembrane domain-containing protein n=1 Tax=Escallonia herrerae TaxID=1293975 RepID=A0AA88WZH5_9ASTE|nr:hypothetical protein RJ639_034083 [Escallonia herrerae]